MASVGLLQIHTKGGDFLEQASVLLFGFCCVALFRVLFTYEHVWDLVLSNSMDQHFFCDSTFFARKLFKKNELNTIIRTGGSLKFEPILSFRHSLGSLNTKNSIWKPGTGVFGPALSSRKYKTIPHFGSVTYKQTLLIISRVKPSDAPHRAS